MSEDYLRAAWEHLSLVLEQNQIAVHDLSWGWMHPGGTRFDDANRAPTGGSAPSDHFGWTSCELSEIWRTDQLHHFDELLKVGTPPLRCKATWRSFKWRITPNDFPLALKLIEALFTADIVEWSPEAVLVGTTAEPPELWQRAVLAIRDNDQEYLDRILEEAKRSYTSWGFRILILGCKRYLDGGGYTGTLKSPLVEELYVSQTSVRWLTKVDTSEDAFCILLDYDHACHL